MDSVDDSPWHLWVDGIDNNAGFCCNTIVQEQITIKLLSIIEKCKLIVSDPVISVVSTVVADASNKFYFKHL